MEHETLTEKIIGCAMTVHNILGPGFLESVYQNALNHELKKIGLGVECESKIKVFYEGVTVGDFIADIAPSNCACDGCQGFAISAAELISQQSTYNCANADPDRAVLLRRLSLCLVLHYRALRRHC